MLVILTIFGILNKSGSPTKKEDEIKYGIKGGVYEIRYSKKLVNLIGIIS